MTHRDDLWDALKAHKKQKFDADRKRFLTEAMQKDDGEWIKHTEFHWSKTLNGNRLDYWPSRKKFQYKGVVMRGDVLKFIAKHQAS